MRSYKTLAWFFVLAMVATHVFFLWHVRQRIARGDPDFTVLFTAAKILQAGQGAHLYDPRTQEQFQRQFTANSEIRRGPLPYIHPPFEAVVFVPLTPLPYEFAFALWDVVNFGLLFVVAVLLKGFVEVLRDIPALNLVLFGLAFFPVFAAFHQGQDSILLLLLVTLGIRAVYRGSYFAAGAWLGFGVFKYHLIVPLVIILIGWKGVKLLIGFLATASGMAALSVLLVGWHAALEYPRFAWQVVTNPGMGGIPLSQRPNLSGIAGGWAGMEHLGLAGQIAIVAIALALLLGVIQILRQSRTPLELGLGCAVIAALLAGYTTNTYDLCLLLLPIVFVADYCLRFLRNDAQARTVIFAPLVPLLISPLWFFLWLRWEQIHLMAIFLILWLLAIGHEILRARANEPARLSAVQLNS